MGSKDIIKSGISREENHEEIIAVIAAAVAAYMDLNTFDINIRTIRRIPQNTNLWSEMGKIEQLFGRL